jgi:hypothetical protein
MPSKGWCGGTGFAFAPRPTSGAARDCYNCYLNRFWGVPVFAVDRSGDMLRLARRNCRSESICFLQQDIRCLALPSRVDLTTANFDTLNHLTAPEDLRLALSRVAANLRTGGHLSHGQLALTL